LLALRRCSDRNPGQGCKRATDAGRDDDVSDQAEPDEVYRPARLTERWPDRYTGWTPTSLAAALKPHGIRPEQVWATDPDTGAERNRRGYTLTALTQATTTERNQNEG